uniref:BTB domain-containing protein n=1 Tax=Oryza punctata TaxID=4537 RepID=A0A0E0LX09_ORYPU
MYFASRSELEKKYVSGDGWVTIVCGVLIPSDSPQALSPPPPPSGGGEHIGSLMYGADDTADVAFVVDGETFHTHRAVLAARSPVFRVALFGSMAEATMPTSTRRRYGPCSIYMDALPDDIDELAGFSPVDMFQHLLAAAERYALGGLKLLPTKKLLDNVTPENVAGIILCAETYGCPELKKKCLDYLARKDEHFRKAATTQGYVRLMQDFPSVMDEIRASHSSSYNPEKLVSEILFAIMFAGRFAPFIIDYSVTTKNLATGDFVSSDEFSAGGHLWRIECYTRMARRRRRLKGVYVSLFLRLCSESNGVKVIFEAFVLTGDGELTATAAQRTRVLELPVRQGTERQPGGWVVSIREARGAGEELRDTIRTRHFHLRDSGDRELRRRRRWRCRR